MRKKQIEEKRLCPIHPSDEEAIQRALVQSLSPPAEQSEHTSSTDEPMDTPEEADGHFQLTKNDMRTVCQSYVELLVRFTRSSTSRFNSLQLVF